MMMCVCKCVRVNMSTCYLFLRNDHSIQKQHFKTTAYAQFYFYFVIIVVSFLFCILLFFSAVIDFNLSCALRSLNDLSNCVPEDNVYKCNMHARIAQAIQRNLLNTLRLLKRGL